MAKTIRSFKLANATIRQLDWLADYGYNGNRTAVVETAIDRMFIAERSTMNTECYDLDLRNRMVRTAIVKNGVTAETLLWERGGDYRGEDIQNLTGKTITELHALGFRKRADNSEHPGA
jgi:hypothetical protein